MYMDKISQVILDNGYSVRHAFEGAGGFESISNSHFRVTLAVCMFSGKLFVDGFQVYDNWKDNFFIND